VRKTALAGLAAWAWFGVTGLQAQTVLRATLEGGEEAPKVATGASGEAIFVIAANKASIEFTLVVKNIGTSVTASHIHLGPRDLAGPVMVPLFDSRTQGTLKSPLTGTLTALDLAKNADLGVNTFADLVDNMLRGNTYTNVHSTKFPGGEIRGQNVPVVEQK